MYLAAIVLAAGKGVRFGARVSKPLIKLGSMPLVAHSLLCLQNHRLIDEIVVVVNAANRGKIIDTVEKYRIHKVKGVVLGGKRRQDSVKRGLAALPGCCDFVLIHDSARPLIDGKTVSSVIREARRSFAAIAGVPVKATIKEASGRYVKKTLDRRNLWEIQTPQVFKKELIVNAYGRFGRSDVTDDAALVEKSGHRVSLVAGLYSNIKITTPEDIPVAQAFFKNKG